MDKANSTFSQELALQENIGEIGHYWPIRHALRVLVVDDQEDNADAIVWLVRGWGHTGYSVSTSVAALQIAASRHPHVVLLDMETQRMDRHQFVHQLRQISLRSDCFLVGYAEQKDDSLRRQCTQSGIDLLLVKPVDPAILEILLLLESELVRRSRSNNDPATKVLAKFHSENLLPDEPDSPSGHRGTGGSQC